MTKRILGLRTVDKDRRSWGGFQWPSSGKVVAPDWNPEPVCGGGLHALIWGMGDGSLLNWDESAIWQAVWVDPDKVVYIGGGKAKFPECEIAIDGTREEVIKFMVENGADVTNIVGGMNPGDLPVANGYRGEAIAEDNHATANGYSGTAISRGYSGSAVANGPNGRAEVEAHYSFATANGRNGRATADEAAGHATADGANGHALVKGRYGFATANGSGGQSEVVNERGHATANGSWGCATANGSWGCATANSPGGGATANGPHGQATANGEQGRASANGPHGQATANGPWGLATATDEYGQATANGPQGRAYARGLYGRAISLSESGTAVAGKCGYAFSGCYASAGTDGVIAIIYDDGGKRRIITGHVGQPGIEPNVGYKVHDGKLVRA